MIIDIQNLAGVATIGGIWLAFFQYRKNLIDRQRQVLVALEAQLDVASSWSSVGNEGFIGSPDEKRKLEYSNPFRFIYGVENFALKDALTQIGAIDFTPRFHNALAQFIQFISTMADQERIREMIGLNNIDTALLIREKIRVESCKPKIERNLMRLSESFGETSEEKKAKNILEIIYQYNIDTHYKTIGSRESGGLKTMHHILIEEIKLQRKKISSQELIDHLLFTLFFLPVILSIFSIFNFEVNNSIQLILLLVVLELIFILLQISTKKYDSRI